MKRTIIEIISLLFAILFLYSGISKVMDYTIFKEQIALSPLLRSTASYIARALPWMEFGVVLLLIIPRWRLKGLYASLVLMILFTLYIIAMLTLNKDIPCSCGGAIELLSWNQHIIFNSVFILMAGTGLVLERLLDRENRKIIASIV